MDAASKQKWVWGVTALLVFGILFIGLALGGVRVLSGVWGKFNIRSTASIRLIFGSDPPAGYVGVGYVYSGSTKRAGLLMNPGANKGLIAIEQFYRPVHANLIETRQLNDLTNWVYNELADLTRYSDTMDYLDLHGHELATVTLPNEKKFLLLKAITTTAQNKTTYYDPVVIGILSLKSKQHLILMLSRLGGLKNVDQTRDFSPEYEELSEALTGIVSSTQLDEMIEPSMSVAQK